MLYWWYIIGMKDFRSIEIIIQINESECANDGIIRYMAGKGYTVNYWEDGKGLVHQYFSNNEYSELWVSFTNYITDTSIVFTLSGNK
jgi:hypothetical protein